MLFSRNKKKEGDVATGALATGLHRTPGLSLLCTEMEKSPPKAILDLGTSSTENLRFLGQYCEQVTIQDIVQVAGGGRIGETASDIPFVLPDIDEIELPEDGTLFDTILLWDVLHYIPREQRPALLVRLSRFCRPGGHLWMIASATAPIPASPMRFRIEGPEKLFYQVSEGRASSPKLNVRQLEKWLPECEPLRLFQLRNGFQELLFRRLGAPKTV